MAKHPYYRYEISVMLPSGRPYYDVDFSPLEANLKGVQYNRIDHTLYIGYTVVDIIRLVQKTIPGTVKIRFVDENRTSMKITLLDGKIKN